MFMIYLFLSVAALFKSVLTSERPYENSLEEFLNNSFILSALNSPEFLENNNARRIQEWMITKGFNKSSIEISQVSDGKGMGIIAGEDLEENRTLFEIPLQYCLCLKKKINFSLMGTSMKEKSLHSEVEIPKLPQPHDYMALNFLYHFYNRNYSPFKEFFYSLPRKIYIPFFTLKREEIHLLNDSGIGSELINNRIDLLYRYQDFTNTLETHLTPEERKLLFKTERIPIGDYFYAYFLNMARGIPTDANSSCLVPLVDLANEFENIVLLDQKPTLPIVKMNGSVIMWSGNRPWKKGEEILVSYGVTFNKQFLIYFGFIPKKNVNECEKFRVFANKSVNEMFYYNFNPEANECINKRELRKMVTTVNIMEYKKPKNLKLHRHCFNLIEGVEDVDEIFRVFNEICEFPVWEQEHNFEELASFLKKKINKYQKLIKKAEKLGRNSSFMNAPLIEKYYQTRLEMVKETSEDLKQIMKKLDYTTDKKTEL